MGCGSSTQNTLQSDTSAMPSASAMKAAPQEPNKTSIVSESHGSEPSGPPVKYPPFLNCVLYPPPSSLLSLYQSEQKSSSDPHKKLSLEFIYGAGVKGVQGNLLYMNGDGSTLIYPAAATNVQFDLKSHTQRVLTVHDDDITCVAQHPVDKNIFASGQTGKNDYVIVWDANTMKQLMKLDTSKAFNPGGVLDLAFNPKNPKQLAIVGGTDVQCSLQVWDWQKGAVIASTSVTQKQTHALAWSPSGDIVWLGDGQIKFIGFDGKKLNVRNGALGTKGQRQHFYSVDFTPHGDTIIGTESGMIYRFARSQLVSKKRAHKGSVRTICATTNGFISGGKDGTIKVWRYGAVPSGEAYKNGDSFDEEEFQDNDDSDEINVVRNYKLGDYTRSVTVNPAETHAYVFENDGDVIELDLSTGSTRHLLYGHNGTRNELWGLDVSRNLSQPLLVTAADDGRILILDYSTRRLLGQIGVKGTQFRGVALSPNLEHVAATSLKGDLYIATVKDVLASHMGEVKKIDTNRKTDDAIAVVQYSPCGEYLAVGSHDSMVHVYAVAKNYAKVATLQDHSASILGLDWSKDSKYLRTVCAAKELLYWRAAGSFTRDKNPSTLCGIVWDSETCVFGWGTRGMWDPSYTDATEINSCDVDFNANVLAFVDDKGKVRIARYPTLSDKVKADSFLGHCSHVTRCRFSPDGKYLFTAGGGDLCTFQWRVEDK